MYPLHFWWWQLHERHREVQRDLQQALSVTSRDRVRAESEAERAETSAKMLHERMARLADRLEKSEQVRAAAVCVRYQAVVGPTPDRSHVGWRGAWS